MASVSSAPLVLIPGSAPGLDWSVFCDDVGFGRRNALLDAFIMKCVRFGAEPCLRTGGAASDVLRSRS